MQIAGAVNAYAALLAKRAGFRALYLSGAGVANVSYGLPDLGITTLGDVLEDTRRLTECTELPLLIDCDTGWGGALMIARTVRKMARAGAAAIHLEDQVAEKRCGHRPGKILVPMEEMVARLHAAKEANKGYNLFLIARTDALGIEEEELVLRRAKAYREAGADALFLEAAGSLATYTRFKEALDIPLLANMTEFGKTRFFSCKELAEAGVSMVLYPLSAQRAMAKAAEQVYGHIRKQGSQKELISRMQTRDELYQILDYDRYEQKALS